MHSGVEVYHSPEGVSFLKAAYNSSTVLIKEKYVEFVMEHVSVSSHPGQYFVIWYVTNIAYCIQTLIRFSKIRWSRMLLFVYDCNWDCLAHLTRVTQGY